MNNELIDQFEQGGQKVLKAIAGLSREELTAFPVPGKWSIQQVVVHLQDAESVAIHRMKQIIAEKKPALLVAWSENEFVKELAYDEQSAEDAARLVDIGRRQFARVLRKLPAEAWDRFGIHTERGKVTVREQLEMYNWHLDHHLKFVYEKRERLGKKV